MKKVFLSLGTLIIVTCLLVTSCAKTNEVELQGPGGGPVCDTINMKFTTNVVPILQANCYSCHGNGNVNGGATLDNYAGVKTQVDNGNLVGVITHAAGYPPMPDGGGKLSDCNINIIKDWIARGAQNN